MGYDAFISYSHGSDLELAKVTRDGLQKLAKPWNRRRALDIFLDQSSLELSSELGSSLGDRIEDTEWLVLFMSETSADSKWVGAEISEWAAKKSKDKIALVLTTGEIVWDDEANDFDYERSSAVNEGMRGVYTGQESEPLHLDMRWTKDVPEGEASLGLDDVRFRDAIATISASIQGKSKDEVEGDDIRAHRRMVRIRRIAVTVLVILTAIAVAAGIFALIKREEAIEEAERATSRALASDSKNISEVETDLAALISLESARVANTPDARGSVANVLSLPTPFLQRVDAHANPVTAIAISDDGTLAASGDDRGTIRVWDVKDEPFPPPQASYRESTFEVGSEIRELAIFQSPDFTGVIAFDALADLTVFDLATGEFDVIPSSDDFTSVALDTERLIVAGLTPDGALTVYQIDPDTLGATEVAAPLQTNSSEVSALTFSPDGSTLGWGDEAGFHLWNWEDGAETGIDTELPGTVSAVAFSPDESIEQAVIAVGLDSGRIFLYGRADPSLKSEVDDTLFSWVNDLSFRPRQGEDGNFTLASAHNDGGIRLWAVNPPSAGLPPFAYTLDTLLGHIDEALQVAFSPDGRIASADFEGEVIWWLDNPRASIGLRRTAEDDDSTVMADAVFVASNQIMALDGNGTAWTWDLASADATAVGDGGELVSSIDASGDIVLLAREDGTAVILSEMGASTVLDSADEDSVGGVAVSNDASQVVTVSDGEPANAVVWDAESGTMANEIALPDTFEPASVLFSHGTIWIGGQNGESDFPVVYRIDPATGTVSAEMVHSDRAGNAVTALAVTDDGGTLATGAQDRMMLLWDTDSLEPTTGTELRGHRGAISGIVFWDEGSSLISSDDSGGVLMWDVSEQRQFAEFSGPTNAVNSLEVDSATSTLLAASSDGAVWTWTLDPESWRVSACELAGRNMSAVEWELFGDGGSRVRHCEMFEIDADGYREATYGESLTD